MTEKIPPESSLLLGPIIGGCSSTSANLWGRADQPGLLHAWLGQDPSLQDATLAGTSLPLSPEDGYCGVVPLRNLNPNTKYYFALTLDPSPPDPTRTPAPFFTTFPPEQQTTSFAFALGSCFLPEDADQGEIYQAILDKIPTYQLSFMILTGDQIYADDPDHNGIGRIAESLSDYRNVYEYAWKRPAFRDLFCRLPVFMTLDDHEVDDDWHWRDFDLQRAAIPWWKRFERKLKRIKPSSLTRERVQNALRAYWEHQGMHAPYHLNPPGHPNLPLGIDPGSGFYTLQSVDPGSFAYTFTFGAAAFLVLDTRTRRTRNKTRKSILGEAQWQFVNHWLTQVAPDFPIQFIVSSSACLTRLWIDILYDRWSGFHTDRNRLMGLIASSGPHGTFLLSGDLHSSHAISADLLHPDGKSSQLWEFCATPLQQKPNSIARYAFNAIPFSRLRKIRQHFCVTQPNFGIVQVEFTHSTGCSVTYTVFDKLGKEINQVTAHI